MKSQSQVSVWDAIKLIDDPNTPWGKVIGYSESTDRWSDCKISILKSVCLFITGHGWRRTEFRLLRPGDEKYDPTPYKVTHII